VTTNIGSAGREGAINNTDDIGRGLLYLADYLRFKSAELQLETASALRSKCPGIKHEIVVAEDAKPF